MIPDSLKSLFWDPDSTIFRVLECGDTEAFKWLRAAFGEAEILRIVRTERRLSPKSATFGALVFGIPESEVAVLCHRHSPGLMPHE
jgi:hypothetical protein